MNAERCRSSSVPPPPPPPSPPPPAPFTTPLSAPVAASLAACQFQPKDNDSREPCWWHACSDLAELTVASLQLDALRRTDASHWRSSLEILLPTACVVYASRCRRRVQVSRLELSFRGSGGLPLGVVPFSPVGSAWFGVRSVGVAVRHRECSCPCEHLSFSYGPCGNGQSAHYWAMRGESSPIHWFWRVQLKHWWEWDREAPMVPPTTG